MNQPLPYHIGFALNDTRDTVWTLMEQGALDRARALGLRLSIRPARSPAEQANAIHRLIDQHVDLLITTPLNYYQPELAAAFRQAQTAGLPILTCNTSTAKPDFARCDVGANFGTVAELAATHLIEQLGARGKLLQIIGAVNDPCTLRVRQVVNRYPDVTLLEGTAEWATERSFDITRATLVDHPDLGAVFAHNDWMALAASEAIAEQGRTGQILVAGVDAKPPALLAIRQGHLQASVNINAAQIGQVAVETALRLLRGEAVPPLIETPVTLVTPANLEAVVLADLAVLPQVVWALADSSAMQRQLQEEIIAAQRRLIHEISTPIIPISDAILVLPLVGAIDSARAQQILEAMLGAIMEHQAEVLIMDITGVPTVDTEVAHHLLQAAQATKLLGTTIILVGITPEVAQTIVHLGVDFSQIITQSTLQTGLTLARAILHKRS